jgi:starch synthase (maltosyl-transferring)
MKGRMRVVIERVRPEVDGGRFPIKRVVGERVQVEVDLFADGHDAVAGVLRYRYHPTDSPAVPLALPLEYSPEPAAESAWQETPLIPGHNDHWRAEFVVDRPGVYHYTVVGWVDHFLTWHRDFQKRVAARQVTAIDLEVGACWVDAAVARASSEHRDLLVAWSRRLRHDQALSHVQRISEDRELESLMRHYPSRDWATTYDHELRVLVDRERAGFSSWYEMFPRSAAHAPGQHGTFQDVIDRLPYVAEMGFDVLYLPPIHPIGTTYRKGRNNAPRATADDVGSPWGIGGAEGGHKAIHPELGTMDDFRRLVQAADRQGMEVALDVALQCSPDHPYVREHPQWFRHRPDGTIQYAENPPKKYQDIYPFDFETADWRNLWEELKSIFLYWIEEGVRIFRVDNPHTKPFPFWEWCIASIKQEHPDVLFLAEAFTRPKIMSRLAKLGFTQSYTYFTWRNTKQELTEYLTELTRTEQREFFRPNFWPNTPDILSEYLQLGGRPAFVTRFVLAALLSSNYGIYGPPFEHGWNVARELGSEEYINSEKYQLHYHDIHRSDSLRPLISHVNRLRRESPALQTNEGLEFHPVDNEQLLCFTKSAPGGGEILLVVVNLDPHHTQSGWVDLPTRRWKIEEHHAYQVHDLLSDEWFLWEGGHNFVLLDPHRTPVHIFRVHRHVHTERDFPDYA